MSSHLVHGLLVLDSVIPANHYWFETRPQSILACHVHTVVCASCGWEHWHSPSCTASHYDVLVVNFQDLHVSFPYMTKMIY